MYIYKCQIGALRIPVIVSRDFSPHLLEVSEWTTVDPLAYLDLVGLRL